MGSLRWLEILAVGVHTLEVTGSALMVALLFFARTVPMVVLGALTGVLADRVDRRRLLRAGLATLLVTACALSALAWSGSLAMWQVALGAFISGCVWTLEHPVRRALIGELVDTGAMGAAVSLDSSTYNGTRMVGPLFGGALYAALGLSGAYIAGVVAYGLGLWLVMGLPSPPPRLAAPRAFWRSLADGLAYVRRLDLVAGVMLVTVVANLFGFSYSAMVPVVGERSLGLDAPGIGLLMSVEGLGASLGALALAFVIRPAAYARVFTGGALLFLVMVFVFAHSANIVAAMAALFCAGLSLAGFGAMQTTILLASTRAALRSRVMGVLVVCIGAGPLGVLIVGTMAEHLGAVTALSVSSSAGLLAMVGICWLRPALLRTFSATPSS